MSELLLKFQSQRKFSDRHLGPTKSETTELLKYLNALSAEDLANRAVPKGIRLNRPLNLPKAATEVEALAHLKSIAKKNKIWRTYIGAGYCGTVVPPVIQRNILENPGWYTQYTPYQAEISQGRLEALLNFQTMISDLTALPVANASLLDEATAAAEAMMMSFSGRKNQDAVKYFVAKSCHPQVIELVHTRAEPVGVTVVVADAAIFEPSDEFFGALFQYPCTNGEIIDYKSVVSRCKEKALLVTMACDILSLVLLEAPGKIGADIAVGNTQRFGVPMGYGGPHAGFMSTTDEQKRRMPG
ncbi:MAG: glycine dehydrogenase (aminomethyl-transferring), partial [Pseudomonadota bacterium]